jgi:hypothetical protein
MKQAILTLLMLVTSIFSVYSTQMTFSVKAGAETTPGCGSLVRLHVEPTWNKLDSVTNANISNVFFIDKDTGFVAGYKGIMLKTVDGGANWTFITTNTISYLNSLTFPTRKRGFVTSSSGFFLTTWDGGSTWQQITTGNNATIKRLAFVNDKIGFATNTTGEVLKTTDCGDNWVTVFSPTDNEANLISFTSTDTGYVANSNGYLVRTTNGGQTWVKVINDLPASGNTLYALQFTSASTGFYASLHGLYKTMDGGKTWALKFSGGNLNIQNIRFVNDQVGYILGKNGLFMKTLDAGDSWYSQNDAGSRGLFDICFPDSTTGYLVGFTGGIFKCGYQKFDSCRWSPANGLDDPYSRYPLADPTVSSTYTVTVYQNGEMANSEVTIDTTTLSLELGKDRNLVMGGSVTLSGKNVNYIGTIPLKYKWTPSTGLSSDTVVYPIASPTETTTYKLTVTSPLGCTATDSIKVYISDFSVNAGGDIIGYCGDSVNLSSSTNYSGTIPLKYKWTPSTGLSNDTIAEPRALVSNITYTLTATTLSGDQQAKDQVSIFSTTPNAPEICMVTVNDQMKNTIMWNRPSTNGVAQYSVYKESTVSDVYTLIGSVSADSLGMLTDQSSNAAVQSNKYKLTATDLCGFESIKSSAHKTMHLSINKGVGTSWNLIWEAYQGITVLTYNIYRGLSLDSMSLIGSCSGSNVQYTDLNAPSGTIYYQLEVVTENGFTRTYTNVNKLRSSVNTNTINSIKSNIAYYLVSGIDDVSSTDPIFTLYPNPAKDQVQLRCNQNKGQLLKLRIYDIAGKLAKQQLVSSDEILSISNLETGLYMVEVESDGMIQRNKLIIQ